MHKIPEGKRNKTTENSNFCVILAEREQDRTNDMRERIKTRRRRTAQVEEVLLFLKRNFLPEAALFSSGTGQDGSEGAAAALDVDASWSSAGPWTCLSNTCPHNGR